MKISGQLTVDDLPRIAPLLCRQTNPRYGEDQTRVVEVGGVRFGNGRPGGDWRAVRGGKP